MKRLCLAALCVVFFASTCKLPTDSKTDDNGTESFPVVLSIPQAGTDENSTYRVVISGEGVDTIGPLIFPASQPVVFGLPEGNDIRVFCGKYDSSGTLLDSGSVVVDVVKEMGWLEIRLTALPVVPESAAPSISRQPSDQTVSVGATASFSVVSSGTQLSYQWQKESFDLPGATGATFFIPAVRLTDDSTRYRCIVKNQAGSDTSASALLRVASDYQKDTIPPVITLLDGDTVRIELGDPDNRVQYYSDQVKITDNCGGPVTKLEVQSNIDIFTVNTTGTPYTILYQFVDSSGNVGTATRYVFIYKAVIKDTIPPIITIGEPTMYLPFGTPFSEPGVSVYDANDGVIPIISVIVDGKVNQDAVGEYLLTYTVADAAGNKATSTRKVVVQLEVLGPDRVSPVITLIGADTVMVPKTLPMREFIASFQDPGFTAIDKVDGDVAGKVRVSAFIQLSEKIWCKTYDVSDSAGNAALTVRRYFISSFIDDPVPPLIDLVFPDSIIQLVLPVSGPAVWKEPGYIAVDVFDGDITSKVIVDSSDLIANLDKVGTYYVIYSVTSSYNLRVVKTRPVKIIASLDDFELPTINLNGRNPDTVTVKSVTSYVEPGFTAIDARDGDITAGVTPTGTVNVNAPGKYIITYSVSDRAGNQGKATRVVRVVRDTSNGDLLVRFEVPSATSLPSLMNKTYVILAVDGDGPDLSGITKMQIAWDASITTFLQLYISTIGEPYFIDLSRSSQTLGSTGPKLTVNNSHVPGLDGIYYVSTLGNQLYWVETTGRYAIVWQEKE